MRPLGRIFQVTEVLDFRKYFLDIDKINHYPITFVIKTELNPEKAMRQIEKEAKKQISDETVLKRYLRAVEEIITIPSLDNYMEAIVNADLINELVKEIIIQCKIEFNIPI